MKSRGAWCLENRNMAFWQERVYQVKGCKLILEKKVEGRILKARVGTLDFKKYNENHQMI